MCENMMNYRWINVRFCILCPALTCILLSLLVAANQVHGASPPFKVKCPGFNTEPPLSSDIYSLEANSEYCRCQLHSTGSGKTVIIKCDFEYREDIILDEELFDFKFYNATSAYVRMIKSKSTYIQSTFFYKWMQTPSSAIDMWNCGKLLMESTVKPVSFGSIRTFVGFGIVNCTIESFPSYLLRDRTRGALRFKECNIGVLNTGLFHNITEMRYFVLEHSYVQSVEGPLSDTGVIQLSRKSVHSWDGLEIINSTIDYVAPLSFNIAHKSDMEDFIIIGSTLGKLARNAITVVGDINVQITNNKFIDVEPNALQISVNGSLRFEDNMIKSYQKQSFSGVACTSEVHLDKNTFYLPYQPKNNSQSPFNQNCGSPKVSFMISTSSSSRNGLHILLTLGLLVACVLIGGVIYGMRTKNFILYRLKRSEIPLCD